MRGIIRGYNEGKRDEERILSTLQRLHVVAFGEDGTDLSDLKTLLEKIDQNTDELELKLDVNNLELGDINLNTDDLEAIMLELVGLTGEVQDVPTQYTILWRLKEIYSALVSIINASIGNVYDKIEELRTEVSTAGKQDDIIALLIGLNPASDPYKFLDIFGVVTANWTVDVGTTVTNTSGKKLVITHIGIGTPATDPTKETQLQPIPIRVQISSDAYPTAVYDINHTINSGLDNCFIVIPDTKFFTTRLWLGGKTNLDIRVTIQGHYV
ncbi:MAG: hypothetical protein ACTSQZ_01995 [Candidatus Thorarchaeota archaeon]